MPTHRQAPAWADGLWLLCLALYILAGAAIVPFHGDESTQIFMGRDYHYLAQEGDLDKILYGNPHERHLRVLNGTIAKNIYGWLQWLNGIGPGDINPDWDWGRDYAANQAAGALPDADLLRQSRLASALQLALAAAAFFQFVKLATNRPTAWLASLLFALQPNLLINGRRAMMEGSHILGMTLVLLAAVWLLRERRWWQYALLGFCAGLAVAAKHPNAIICGLVYLALARQPLWQLARSCFGSGRGNWRGAGRQLLGLALAGLLAALVFLLLNPAWWRNPLAVAQEVVAGRQSLLQDQVRIFGGYESFSAQISGFFEFVFMGARQYFEVDAWQDYAPVTAQIAAYESSGLAGLLVISGSGRLGALSLLLCGFGAMSLLRDPGPGSQVKWLLGIWIIGSALSTLWLTPLPWARYYLPLLPALILLVSIALHHLAQWLAAKRVSDSDGVALLD